MGMPPQREEVAPGHAETLPSRGARRVPCCRKGMLVLTTGLPGRRRSGGCCPPAGAKLVAGEQGEKAAGEVLEGGPSPFDAFLAHLGTAGRCLTHDAAAKL